MGIYIQEHVSIETQNAQTPQAKRLTTHDGEIIFHAGVEAIAKNEMGQMERIEKAIEQLTQQSQKNKIQINENQRVFKPESLGIYRPNPTQEVKIIRVFYQPSGLMYEVKFKLSSIEADDKWTRSAIIKIEDVLEIPGETKIGIFNLSTGTID